MLCAFASTIPIFPPRSNGARMAAGAWNRETGMPYGTRLRIKASWWNANADAVLGTGTQARIIGEALRRYGCILADGSGGTTIRSEEHTSELQSPCNLVC